MVGSDCDLRSEDQATIGNTCMEGATTKAEIDILVRLVDDNSRLLFEFIGYRGGCAKRW